MNMASPHSLRMHHHTVCLYLAPPQSSFPEWKIYFFLLSRFQPPFISLLMLLAPLLLAVCCFLPFDFDFCHIPSIHSCGFLLVTKSLNLPPSLLIVLGLLYRSNCSWRLSKSLSTSNGASNAASIIARSSGRSSGSSSSPGGPRLAFRMLRDSGNLSETADGRSTALLLQR